MFRTHSPGAAGCDGWDVRVLSYRLAQFRKNHRAAQAFEASLHGMKLQS